MQSCKISIKTCIFASHLLACRFLLRVTASVTQASGNLERIMTNALSERPSGGLARLSSRRPGAPAGICPTQAISWNCCYVCCSHASCKTHTLDSDKAQDIPGMLTYMHSNEIPTYKICFVSMTTPSIAQVMPIDMLCRHR